MCVRHFPLIRPPPSSLRLLLTISRRIVLSEYFIVRQFTKYQPPTHSSVYQPVSLPKLPTAVLTDWPTYDSVCSEGHPAACVDRCAHVCGAGWKPSEQVYASEPVDGEQGFIFYSQSHKKCENIFLFGMLCISYQLMNVSSFHYPAWFYVYFFTSPWPISGPPISKAISGPPIAKPISGHCRAVSTPLRVSKQSVGTYLFDSLWKWLHILHTNDHGIDMGLCVRMCVSVYACACLTFVSVFFNHTPKSHDAKHSKTHWFIELIEKHALSSGGYTLNCSNNMHTVCKQHANSVQTACKHGNWRAVSRMDC